MAFLFTAFMKLPVNLVEMTSQIPDIVMTEKFISQAHISRNTGFVFFEYSIPEFASLVPVFLFFFGFEFKISAVHIRIFILFHTLENLIIYLEIIESKGIEKPENDFTVMLNNSTTGTKVGRIATFYSICTLSNVVHYILFLKLYL